MGWLQSEAIDAIYELEPADFLRIDISDHDGADIWVFVPDDLWIRLVERAGVVVISFHYSSETP